MNISKTEIDRIINESVRKALNEANANQEAREMINDQRKMIDFIYSLYDRAYYCNNKNLRAIITKILKFFKNPKRQGTNFVASFENVKPCIDSMIASSNRNPKNKAITETLTQLLNSVDVLFTEKNQDTGAFAEKNQDIGADGCTVNSY